MLYLPPLSKAITIFRPEACTSPLIIVNLVLKAVSFWLLATVTQSNLISPIVPPLCIPGRIDPFVTHRPWPPHPRQIANVSTDPHRTALSMPVAYQPLQPRGKPVHVFTHLPRTVTHALTKTTSTCQQSYKTKKLNPLAARPDATSWSICPLTKD